ncbi:hypothetical protein QUF80_12595 [Desulfococcaceae bacterium HSG8]|nr:hypothetical protein [Desulfococcaceae bacterium HSG8]
MIMIKYPEIPVIRKSGSEKFHINGKTLNFDLLSFWQWSSSDLVNNAMRGILAEFIVLSAVGKTDGNRVEWDSYDIETKEGIKVEVKSASYLQSWSQKELSAIKFSIRPTLGWDFKTNSYSTEIKRQSDVYVFCLLKHKIQETLDPLDLNQWEFMVMPTLKLSEAVGSQKTITLKSLQRLNPKIVPYSSLYQTIKMAFR